MKMSYEIHKNIYLIWNKFTFKIYLLTFGIGLEAIVENGRIK